MAKAVFPYEVRFEPDIKGVRVEVDAEVEFTPRGVEFRPVLTLVPIVDEEPRRFIPILDINFLNPNLLRYA